MSTWYEQAIFYHMYPLGMTGLKNWISGSHISVL